MQFHLFSKNQIHLKHIPYTSYTFHRNACQRDKRRSILKEKKRKKSAKTFFFSKSHKMEGEPNSNTDSDRM